MDALLEKWKTRMLDFRKKGRALADSGEDCKDRKSAVFYTRASTIEECVKDLERHLTDVDVAKGET